MITLFKKWKSVRYALVVLFFLFVILAILVTWFTVQKIINARKSPEGNICSSWSLVGRGTNLVPLYPNTYTAYWWWDFLNLKRSNSIAFRITGQFPYARFMAFQSYSGHTGSALTDYEIIPNEESVNPFQFGQDRYASNRSYTLWFVPPESERVGKPNTFIIPQDTTSPNLLLRIILSDQGKEENNGGVPLPLIEAFDDKTGNPVSCPPKTLPFSLFNIAPVSYPPAENEVSFYYIFEGDEFGRNRAGIPLFALLPQSWQGKIALIRFKIPTFPDTYGNPQAVFKEEDQTRMTMICAHGLRSTLTSECLSDYELRSSGDGFARIIVGPNDDALKDEAHRRGYDYLNWSPFISPALFYRQVLPREDFEGSAFRVPVYNADAELEPQGAEHFMGDYAPLGTICDQASFLAGEECNIP